nr:helitron helicase-like domain-containing protein [Tanacetum cinerariifolium]
MKFSKGIRDSALCCVKRRSLVFSSPDAFTRYSELCGRNVLAKSSLDISPAVESLDFNVFGKYSDLCRTNAVTGTYSILFNSIIDNVSKKTQRSAPVVESSSKTPRKLYGYVDLGDCDQQCQHCGAAFWLGERLNGHSNYRTPEYHLCCGGGRIHMQHSEDPPEYFKNLLQNKHFMDNIRAYNQMFSMTSFGVKIDESINDGRGPYVFKVSGQVYHWIRSLCPPPGESPRFLQLYIYDTNHEVENRMRHFGGQPEINAGKFIFHNLKLRLYNAEGARGYELPASNVLGAVVFNSGVSCSTDFDIIIQEKAGPPKRISKLHKSYMSLQFPLLFIYGQPGFYPELKLRRADGSRQE